MILHRDFIHGVNTILRYIARAASVSSFYGQDDIQAAQVCSGFTVFVIDFHYDLTVSWVAIVWNL